MRNGANPSSGHAQSAIAFHHRRPPNGHGAVHVPRVGIKRNSFPHVTTRTSSGPKAAVLIWRFNVRISLGKGAKMAGVGLELAGGV